MNDYWNDPPEEPEPPEDFNLDEIAEPDPGEKCPHGKPWGDCGECDHLSDLAYDAAREARFSR